VVLALLLVVLVAADRAASLATERAVGVARCSSSRAWPIGPGCRSTASRS
jgi:hypothetical protein